MSISAMANGFSSPTISTRLVPVRLGILDSDDESIDSGRGSPSNPLVGPTLPSPCREGNEGGRLCFKAQGEL